MSNKFVYKHFVANTNTNRYEQTVVNTNTNMANTEADVYEH